MPNGAGAGWRQLISGTISADIERERAGGTLGNALKRLFADIEAKKVEVRKGAQRGREIAQTALFQKRPEMAAAHLGIEYPEAEVTGGPPEGLVASEWKDPDTGVKYKLPTGDITARQLGTWYTKYVSDIRTVNAEQSWMKGRKGFENYQEIPIPEFTDWVKENFPEYIDKLRVVDEEEGAEELSDDELNEYLTSQGFESSAENRRILRRNLGQQRIKGPSARNMGTYGYGY